MLFLSHPVQNIITTCVVSAYDYKYAFIENIGELIKDLSYLSYIMQYRKFQQNIFMELSSRYQKFLSTFQRINVSLSRFHATIFCKKVSTVGEMTFLFLDDSKTLPARYINISFCFRYCTLIGLSCTRYLIWHKILVSNQKSGIFYFWLFLIK